MPKFKLVFERRTVETYLIDGDSVESVWGRYEVAGPPTSGPHHVKALEDDLVEVIKYDEPEPPPTPARILRNVAKCSQCDDVIESKHRHDFVTCKCGAISVDGGRAYLKRSAANLTHVIELSEFEPD